MRQNLLRIGDRFENPIDGLTVGIGPILAEDEADEVELVGEAERSGEVGDGDHLAIARGLEFRGEIPKCEHGVELVLLELGAEQGRSTVNDLGGMVQIHTCAGAAGGLDQEPGLIHRAAGNSKFAALEVAEAGERGVGRRHHPPGSRRMGRS